MYLLKYIHSLAAFASAANPNKNPVSRFFSLRGGVRCAQQGLYVSDYDWCKQARQCTPTTRS